MLSEGGEENSIYRALATPFNEIIKRAGTALATSSITKVVQIIKYTSTVFIDNFRNISTNSHRYRYQFAGEVMMDM